MEYLSYQDTPVSELIHPVLDKKGIRLLIKREDLNHPFVSGNKWWKLKYNMIHARNAGFKTVLTFGGAYSNHIYATAAAAHNLGFRCIGIIRGEQALPLNATLAFAEAKGMVLHHVSREVYRNKSSPIFLASLHEQFGDFHLIPEGGTNALALKGTVEFGEILQSLSFDQLLLPVGTAGTIAGIIIAYKGNCNICGLPVLKNGDFLNGEIESLVKSYSGVGYNGWSLLTDYHFGGYAKTTPGLIQFIKEMKHTYGLPLDHVYTGKLIYGIFTEIKKDTYARGTTLLAIHTGGLQGALDVDAIG